MIDQNKTTLGRTTIDFSPLDDPNPEVVENPLTDISSTKRAKGPKAVLLWIFVWALPSTIVTTLVASIALSGWLLFAVFGLIVSFWVWVIWRNVSKTHPHNTRLSNFAVVNGYGFKLGLVNEFGYKEGASGRNITNNSTRDFKGILARDQRAVRTAAEISGTLPTGETFAFYSVMQLTRSGLYSVFEVSLKQLYPHIFLDSKHNEWITSNLAYLFDDSNRVNLEATFQDYFTLYSNVSPTLSLQVIEPSVMQPILDNALKFDIEIVEDRLYLIASYTELDSLGMQYLFNSAVSIVKNLDRAPL